MDVTRMLEGDHRKAEALIATVKRASGDERAPLVEQLMQALRGHMELEETVVYPVMKELSGEEALREANTEHELARRAMTDVIRLAPDEPGFGAALDALEAGLAHHIREEEAETFPALRAADSALEAMVAPFMQKRVALGIEMDAPALAEAFTKDELLKQAESVGVASSSKMNKSQLAEALVAQLAS